MAQDRGDQEELERRLLRVAHPMCLSHLSRQKRLTLAKVLEENNLRFFGNAYHTSP